MKTALIIHGVEGHSGVHWQQWLHDELIRIGYKVMMPTFPHPDHPDRFERLQTARKLVGKTDVSKLTIVGHSLGVATALDLIETVGKKIDTLISVSGFAVDYGADLNGYFMRERNINLKKVRELVRKKICYLRR